MNECSECGGVGGCKIGCAGPPKPRPDLNELAKRIDSEASISARPGQLDRLEEIAQQLRLVAADTIHRDIEQACKHLDDALNEYRLKPAQLDPDYVDGIVMGMRLSLNVIWQFTKHRHGKPAGLEGEAA